jgi:LPXTG-site transpeptidase (sortase) family protein
VTTPTTGPEGIATIPAPCRDLTFDPSATLTDSDLMMRGYGTPIHSAFLGVNLVIRKIGVDAPLVVRTVGTDGDMPDPNSPTDVAWYDFSQFVGLGGTPGTDSGNVVIAGNFDYTNAPQAVFFRLSELVPGDIIQINTSDGRTLAYGVEFNKTATVDGIDWSLLVSATPEESITLITAAAPRNVDRRIVWGRALTTACS